MRKHACGEVLIHSCWACCCCCMCACARCCCICCLHQLLLLRRLLLEPLVDDQQFHGFVRLSAQCAPLPCEMTLFLSQSLRSSLPQDHGRLQVYMWTVECVRAVCQQTRNHKNPHVLPCGLITISRRRRRHPCATRVVDLSCSLPGGSACRYDQTLSQLSSSRMGPAKACSS